MREAKTCIITCGLPINCVRACLPKPKPNANIMIEHNNNETTNRNQRNVNQSANHSPSPLDSNSIPTTRQHAINSTTRQHLIRATAKEPQNPQNHNKPSQTNKMNKLKKRQRQLHFTGASVQTTIKQLTTRPQAKSQRTTRPRETTSH